MLPSNHISISNNGILLIHIPEDHERHDNIETHAKIGEAPDGRIQRISEEEEEGCNSCNDMLKVIPGPSSYGSVEHKTRQIEMKDIA